MYYHKRGTAEQWIKQGRNAIKWTRLSCGTFRNNALRLQLHALACNLADFMRTLALPKEVEHWSLTTLRQKLVKIGGKMVSHGRYVTSQLAELAVPRDLVCKTRRLIDELRPTRAQAQTEGIDGKLEMTGEVHLDEREYGQMALANGLPYTGRPKDQVTGRLRRPLSSLEHGTGV